MDTIYYNLNPHRVKVSGGADLLTFLPAPVPAPAAPGGEVLDFDRCRRKLETKAAWKELRRAGTAPLSPEEAPLPERPAPRPRRARFHLADWWELLLSGAAILLTFSTGIALLSLL